MAKYNRYDKNVRMAKEFNNISFSKDISLETTLKSFDKEKRVRKLYSLGLSWFNDGNKLQDALELVVLDGEEMMLKDIIYFQRGYEAGLNMQGFSYGYDGVSLADVDNEYSSNRYFLEGYKDGMLKKVKEENKKNKR